MKLLSTIHLTDNQKRVIAKVIASPTPTVAGEEISKNANIVAARNMLMKLGLLTFVDGHAEVSEKGMKIAKDQNLVDDTGALTDVGQKLASTMPNGQPTDGEQQDQPPMGGMDMGMDGGMDPSMDPPVDPNAPPQSDELNIESFTLLKELLR